MSFGGFDQHRDEPMAEINVIPLVDIMLVLLVIFIITAPVLTHAVKVDMPRASSQVNEEEPHTITLAIDAAGKLYWNDQPAGFSDLERRLTQAAQNRPETVVQIRADRQTPYAVIARIMASGSNAGIQSIGFVMEPE